MNFLKVLCVYGFQDLGHQDKLLSPNFTSMNSWRPGWRQEHAQEPGWKLMADGKLLGWQARKQAAVYGTGGRKARRTGKAPWMLPSGTTGALRGQGKMKYHRTGSSPCRVQGHRKRLLTWIVAKARGNAEVL